MNRPPKAINFKNNVSVLITAFNCERHIKECLSSILNQDFNGFEVVLINDGSTDRTSDFARELNCEKRKVFDCERMGRAKSLNFGIERCEAEYIAILDADDVALPGRLNTQFNFLNENPDIVICGSKYRTFIDEYSQSLGREDVEPTEFADIIIALQKRTPLFHSSVMFRKSIIKAMKGYDESISCLLDRDIYVRASILFKIANIDARLSLKRIHKAQYFAGEGGVHFSKSAEAARLKIDERAKYLGSLLSLFI